MHGTTYSQVVVHTGSSIGRELPKADAVYVCAAATTPSWAWIDALLPSGRLMFPLAPEFGLGGMLRVTRPQAGDRWPATFVSRARFIGCTGLQGDPEENERLIRSFAEGWDRVRSLRFDDRMDETCWFAGTGQNIDYVAIEAPIGDFNEAVDKFRREGGLGLNIAEPFKLDAFAYCTDLKERARLGGAVNAMKFEVDRVTGENFDGVGLTNDITRNLGRSMKGRRVALLGAGGAARGVVLPFLEQGPAELVIVNRTATKAEELGCQFRQYGPITAIGYSDLGDKNTWPVRSSRERNLCQPARRASADKPRGLWRRLPCL
ncbi:hypothetical protein [Bradyrhizobium elkanii]|uniref:hypothetical protein n=1 Tax=Bradyrhizobium elkanii TaxID=29448 RepID=UPI00068798C2|nr:hypothetical protein [Bradyrhizobium elkanii]